MLTQERVKTLLDYDPETGVLRWKVDRNQYVKSGDEAGHLQIMHKGRYRCVRVCVDGRLYIASRIIWLWMTGSFPEHDIDHKDQCPMNNRWDNLRDTQHNQKNFPRRADNRSGCTGVGWHKASSRWRARINVDGTAIFIGSFTRRSDAIRARKRASKQYGFSELHGR